MAGNQTSNYHLNQWEPEDKVLRTEFNGDNQKIENALTGLAAGKASASELAAVAATVPKIVTGTYTGDGAAQRTIELGFRPKAVLLFHENGYTCYYFDGHNCYGGLILDGIPLILDNAQGRRICAEITDGGFGVRYYLDTSRHLNAFTNSNGQVYHYIAVV